MERTWISPSHDILFRLKKLRKWEIGMSAKLPDFLMNFLAILGCILFYAEAFILVPVALFLPRHLSPTQTRLLGIELVIGGTATILSFLLPETGTTRRKLVGAIIMCLALTALPFVGTYLLLELLVQNIFLGLFIALVSVLLYLAYCRN